MSSEDIEGLQAAGLNPIIIDENTKLPAFHIDLGGNVTQYPSVKEYLDDATVFNEANYPIELDKNGRPKKTIKTKKAVATRNRAAGFTWEYRVRDYLKGLYPDITTTHGNSKHLDAQKIDFMNKDERANGFLPFNLQAKTGAQPSLYESVFRDIPKNGIPNVIAFKYTRKASSKFMSVGEYALMELKDWFYYLEIEKKYKELQISYQKLGHSYNKVEEDLDKALILAESRRDNNRFES